MPTSKRIFQSTLLAVLMAGPAVAPAQDAERTARPDPVRVELSREIAMPGQVAVVTLRFAGNGESAGFGGDIVIGEPDAVSEIDLSGCLGDYTAMVGTCVHPGGDENRVRVLLANDETTALDRFSGTIFVRIAPDARPGTVIPVRWDDNAWDVAAPQARVKAASGWITVGQPRPGPVQ